MPGVIAVAADGSNRWTAWQGGANVGSLLALIRPDQRCFLRFVNCVEQAYGPLLSAAAHDQQRELYLEVEESDIPALGRYRELGFVDIRRELNLSVPIAPAGTVARPAHLPGDLDMITADAADPDRLRLLDDQLRQDVPGTAGWRWEPEAFAVETFNAPDYDPAAYLITVERPTDAYLGLARVWLPRPGPRLGLVGAVPEHRRRGIATAMLATVFHVLAGRGYTAVCAEVDQTNHASLVLLSRFGAHQVGASVELLLPIRSPKP
jgi:ribosomal protein S18 acetylase RimI-like enzyme